jgi:hypothetical protein
MAGCMDGYIVQYSKDLDSAAKSFNVLGITIINEHLAIILFRHLPAAQGRARQ